MRTSAMRCAKQMLLDGAPDSGEAWFRRKHAVNTATWGGDEGGEVLHQSDVVDDRQAGFGAAGDALALGGRRNHP
jgi:hypothetical protein